MGYSINPSSSISNRLEQLGNGFDLGGSGDWTVNIGGSATAYQNASGGGTGIKLQYLLIAGAVVAWLLFNR